MRKAGPKRKAWGDRLGMVERVQIKRDWQRDTVETLIHAYIGEDGHLLVQKMAHVMCIAMTAARAAKVAADNAYTGRVRAAVDCIPAQLGHEFIAPDRRAAFIDGLWAATLLAEQFEVEVLFASAMQIQLHVGRNGLSWAELWELTR